MVYRYSTYWRHVVSRIKQNLNRWKFGQLNPEWWLQSLNQLSHTPLNINCLHYIFRNVNVKVVVLRKCYPVHKFHYIIVRSSENIKIKSHIVFSKCHKWNGSQIFHMIKMKQFLHRSDQDIISNVSFCYQKFTSYHKSDLFPYMIQIIPHYFWRQNAMYNCHCIFQFTS